MAAPDGEKGSTGAKAHERPAPSGRKAVGKEVKIGGDYGTNSAF